MHGVQDGEAHVRPGRRGCIEVSENPIGPQPAWRLIMPNTCPNRLEHDRASLYLPSSATMTRAAGGLDS